MGRDRAQIFMNEMAYTLAGAPSNKVAEVLRVLKINGFQLDRWVEHYRVPESPFHNMAMKTDNPDYHAPPLYVPNFTYGECNRCHHNTYEINYDSIIKSQIDKVAQNGTSILENKIIKCACAYGGDHPNLEREVFRQANPDLAIWMLSFRKNYENDGKSEKKRLEILYGLREKTKYDLFIEVHKEYNYINHSAELYHFGLDTHSLHKVQKLFRGVIHQKKNNNIKRLEKKIKMDKIKKIRRRPRRTRNAKRKQVFLAKKRQQAEWASEYANLRESLQTFD
jgi:hypothetical protein